MSTQRKRRHTTSAQSGRARSFERQGTQPPASGNAAETFVDRHLGEGRGAKVAIRTLEREVTYAELAEQVNRYGNALLQLPVRRGERVLMVVTDCPEFFFLFWGAIKAGVIPVPLNTLLRANDLAFIVRDSGCKSLIYSDEFLAEVGAALAAPGQPAIDARCRNWLAQLPRCSKPSTSMPKTIASGSIPREPRGSQKAWFTGMAILP
jgi:acyl-CoA synthetase (AMP-forming)/AMP-acid ligase II